MRARKPPSWRRYLSFWGANPRADVDDELRFHVEMRTAEYIAQGLSPEAARGKTAMRLGNLDAARAECLEIDQARNRVQDRWRALTSLRQDVLFAARVIRRQWLPSAVAALCLALGIGATTSLFSVGSTLLLRPLPYPNGERLVALYSSRHGAHSVTSYPDFLDWRARQRSFTDIAAFGSWHYTIDGSEPTRVAGGIATSSLFRVLGVTPEFGRLPTEEEGRPGAANVLLVSHGFAERMLGGAAHAVGKKVSMSGTPWTVIGVIPEYGRFDYHAELWVPIPAGENFQSRGNRNLPIFGVLRDGVTLDAAKRDIAGIGAQLAREYPRDDAELTTDAATLREAYVGGVRPAMIALAVASLLVLVIACANVAGLQLARAASRAREIGVRGALGASRSRIARQLLTESVMLALVGAVGGVAIALRGGNIVGQAIQASGPPWMVYRVDLVVLAFSVAISVLSGLGFGLVPALRLARLDPNDVLRGGRGEVGAARANMQRIFVGAQVALSLVLVVGAGFALQSVRTMTRIPLGFDPKGVATFSVAMQGARYDDPAARGRFIAQLTDRISVLPGVEVASAVSLLPVFGCCSQYGTDIEGQPAVPGHRPMITGTIITPGYLRALRIPVIQGRDITRDDDASAAPVILINETFAHKYWPKGDALGHRINGGGGWRTIVGVVGDVQQNSLIAPAEPQFFRPYAQDPQTDVTYAVRVAVGDPMGLASGVRRTLHELDPMIELPTLSTLQRRVDRATSAEDLFGELFAAAALIALVLASAGVYAVMSFIVSQRTREMGLRMALGATAGGLRASLLGQGLAIAGAGATVGLVGAGLSVRALTKVLYGIDPARPWIYAAAAAALAVVALVATYAPARRASAVDPMVALRVDG